MLAVSVYALLVRFGEDRHAAELAIKLAPAQLAAGFALGAAMFGTVMAILVAFDLYTVDWIVPHRRSVQVGTPSRPR